MQRRSSQQGFLLFQLMIATAIMGIITASLLTYQARVGEDSEFRDLGARMAAHSKAVTLWIVDQDGTAVPATYTGTNWLKSNSDCGITTGSGTAYLPCGFSFNSGRFGGSATTVVTNIGGVTTATTTWTAINEGGSVKIIGAAKAVNRAQADTRETLEGVVTYSANNSAVITATIAVNNAESLYVKRSGDSMTGHLDMTGNNINNVGVITASQGSFSTSSLGAATANSLNTNTLSATNGTITNLNSTDLEATSSTITDLSATNLTTSDLNVAGTANINNLDGNLQIQSVKVPGSACIGSGRLARTLDGDILTCKGSLWAQSEASGGMINYSSCYYVNYWTNIYFNACPSNYVFVGGYRRGSDTYEWNGFTCCQLN